MTTESEARQTLRDHMIERGMDDPRSCLEIAREKGLLPVAAQNVVITPIPLPETQPDDTVLLSRSQPSPYFARPIAPEAGPAVW